MISRDPLKTRLALSVLAEGKSAHGRNEERAEDIPHRLEQGEHPGLGFVIIYLFHNISSVYCD